MAMEDEGVDLGNGFRLFKSKDISLGLVFLPVGPGGAVKTLFGKDDAPWFPLKKDLGAVHPSRELVEIFEGELRRIRRG